MKALAKHKRTTTKAPKRQPAKVPRKHFIFVHGLASSVETWSELQYDIEGQGAFWSFSVPGYNPIDPSLEGANLLDVLKPFASFLRQLDGPLFVVGHSMGARYALLALKEMDWYVSEHAEIRAFVIEDIDMEPHYFQKPVTKDAYQQGFGKLKSLLNALKVDGYREKKIQAMATNDRLYQNKGAFFSCPNPAVDAIYQSKLLETNHLDLFAQIPKHVKVLLLRAGKNSLVSQMGLKNMQSKRHFTSVYLKQASHNIHKTARVAYLRALLAFCT